MTKACPAKNKINDIYAVHFKLGVTDMPEIGTITGFAGMITGAIALVISIKSYARVSAMKALDLRLELAKAFNNLDVVLSGIDGYLDFVHQSHVRVLAATGQNQSGAMKLFEDDFAEDKVKLRRLLASQPRREGSYDAYAPAQLEQEIAAVHAFHNQTAELRAKYQRRFDADEERRKEIRAAHTHKA